ncbi:MAG: hypothetical protein LBL61_06945 [Elusimicrobiota bacterium]|jgi:membrane protein YqaA with SNARE-associated domain|nr:hypothetical protein [Elusimicrobiota bacterium]
MRKHFSYALPAIIGIWAFLEATVFFIMPDFLLCPAVIARPKQSRDILLMTVIGSVLGMTALAAVCFACPGEIRRLFVYIPFTSDAMFEKVILEINSSFSVFFQPFSGIPVKVWIWTAIISKTNFFSFFTVIILGRVFRFLMVTLMSLGIEKIVGKPLRNYAVLFLPLYAIAFFIGLWYVSYYS